MMEKEILEKYLSIIKKHYPEVSKENIVFTQGNDHDVFIVNNKVAFRFPKILRQIDQKRSEFLKQFAQFSSLPLPTIEIHKDTDTGIFYEINQFLQGVSFYPAIAKTFSHEELMIVAQKLGKFLSSIHSFSIEEARKLQLDELNPNDFWEYMQNNPNAFPKYKKLVYPEISKEEQAWVEKLFTDFITMAKRKPLPLRVIHGDMWVFHIIVVPQTHTLSGVIDFWGRIADSANDFKAFEYYGKDFIDEVYKNYTVSIDEDFEKRRLFYTGHDEVFEFARQLERGNKERISKQKMSLLDYIENHPL